MHRLSDAVCRWKGTIAESGVLVTVLSRAAMRERGAMCGSRRVERFHVAAVARRYW